MAQISGRVFFIGKTESVPTKSGENFTKRELWLNTCEFDRETGQPTYGENYIKLETTGERVTLIDSLNGGDEVLATYALRGGLYTSKTTNQQDCITRLDLRAIKITKSSVAQPSAQPTASPVAAPTQNAVPQMIVDPKTGGRYYIGKDGMSHWENDVNPDGSYK